jgi:hypothetical protein
MNPSCGAIYMTTVNGVSLKRMKYGQMTSLLDKLRHEKYSLPVNLAWIRIKAANPLEKSEKYGVETEYAFT